MTMASCAQLAAMDLRGLNLVLCEFAMRIMVTPGRWVDLLGGGGGSLTWSPEDAATTAVTVSNMEP